MVSNTDSMQKGAAKIYFMENGSPSVCTSMSFYRAKQLKLSAKNVSIETLPTIEKTDDFYCFALHIHEYPGSILCQI